MQQLITFPACLQPMVAASRVNHMRMRSCELQIMGRPCADKIPKFLRGSCTGTVPVPALRVRIKHGSSFEKASLHCRRCAVCCSAGAILKISFGRIRGTITVRACVPRMQSAGHRNMCGHVQEVQ